MSRMLVYQEEEFSGKGPKSYSRLILSTQGLQPAVCTWGRVLASQEAGTSSFSWAWLCPRYWFLLDQFLLSPDQYHLCNFNSPSCSNSFKDKCVTPFLDQVQTFFSRPYGFKQLQLERHITMTHYRPSELQTLQCSVIHYCPTTMHKVDEEFGNTTNRHFCVKTLQFIHPVCHPFTHPIKLPVSYWVTLPLFAYTKQIWESCRESIIKETNFILYCSEVKVRWSPFSSTTLVPPEGIVLIMLIFSNS